MPCIDILASLALLAAAATIFLAPRLTPWLLALALLIAALATRITLPALACFAALGLAAFLARFPQNGPLRVLGHLLFIVTAAGLMTHLWPGFANIKLSGPVVVSPGAVPTSFYLNFDKPLIAFWIAIWCGWALVDNARPDWWRSALLWGVVTILVCLGLALMLGLVAWSPGGPPDPLIVLLVNLLLVCVPEELLFRGYLQGGLTRLLERFTGAGPQAAGLIALVAAAGLFGLAHHSAGWRYMIVASLAGLGYGLAYRGGGVRAAVIAHFGLNATHMLLFTYPMLASTP